MEVIYFYDVGDLLLQARELSLGCGCPVSYIDHYTDYEIFVFVYLLKSCGIRVHVREFTLTNKFFDKPMVKNQAIEI